MAKILVVDDEKSIADLTPLLESKGYEVITASDGVVGLCNAHTQKPDLIILNFMLPEMNGSEVCRLLKCDSEYEHILVVLLAASTILDEAMRISEEVKADALVMKPYEPEELLAKINELLNK